MTPKAVLDRVAVAGWAPDGEGGYTRRVSDEGCYRITADTDGTILLAKRFPIPLGEEWYVVGRYPVHSLVANGAGLYLGPFRF